MKKRAKGASNLAKIRREEGDLYSLLNSLPLNPVPWGLVVSVLAPIVARLAVRYALKKLDRSMSEDRVNSIGKSVADFVAGIIKRRVDTEVEGGA